MEDHDLTARGIEFVLRANPHHQIVGHARDGHALKLVEELDPDLIILDLYLPGQSGFAVLESLKRQYPAIRVVVNTGQGAVLEYQRALALGAEGLVAKADPSECLVQAIEKVSNGESYRSPLIAERLAHLTGEPTYHELTARELEILQLVAAGHSSREIAGQLGVSELTVKKHRENMTRKLGVSSAVELTHAAQRLGLITFESSD